MTKCAIEGCDTTEKNKKEKKLWLHKFPKGLLISKSLFGIFNSPKKRLKKFDFTTMVPQVKLFSFVFCRAFTREGSCQ